MQPTLLILAAGMASRYGSMKQVEGFGPGGETIMDYSIYDAVRAGFRRVVFIIRSEFADDFKAIFEPKLKGRIATEYVFQELSMFTEGYNIPAERVKPWGTAHAVLCAKSAIDGPFAVINADDFYGKNAFEKAGTFLNTECSEKEYALIGYELLKTLSAHGTVSRGVCDVDANGNLVGIKEHVKVYMQEHKILSEEHDQTVELGLDSKASMNFWCFDQTVFALTEEIFKKFLAQNIENLKSEFFIPLVADKFIKEHGGLVKVIPTSSQWFGVTYKEDAPGVKASIGKLIASGEYPSHLWT